MGQGRRSMAHIERTLNIRCTLQGQHCQAPDSSRRALMHAGALTGRRVATLLRLVRCRRHFAWSDYGDRIGICIVPVTRLHCPVGGRRVLHGGYGLLGMPGGHASSGRSAADPVEGQHHAEQQS